MSLDKVPKQPAKDAGKIRAPMRAEAFTLKKLLTNNDSQPFYVSFLKEMATKKGPWSEYYQFFLANMSGDIESMNAETKKYVEKMIKEIHEKYSEMMG